MIHSQVAQVSMTLKNRRGQGLTEYLILMVLISLVSIAAVKSLGGTIQRKLQMAREHINQVSPHDASR